MRDLRRLLAFGLGSLVLIGVEPMPSARAGAGPVAAPTVFSTVTPCRLFDSRISPPALADGVPRTIPVAGVCGVPSTAVAAAVNITAVQPTVQGRIAVDAAGAAPTLGSPAVNFMPALINRANNAIVRLGAAGAVDAVAAVSGGSVHLVIDVSGYFESMAPALDLDATAAGTGFTAATFTEGGSPVAITDAGDASIYDADSTSLSALTVTIQNPLDTTGEVLDADVTGTSIAKNYVSATSTLELTGTDTVANYETVLRTVTYANNDDDPDTSAARTIGFVASDGTYDSNTAVATVSLGGADDDPVAVDDAATVNEDSSAITIDVLGNDTDVDAGPISVTSVTQPANGTVVITNAGADLTYQPTADYCNDPPGTTPDTFTYTLAPGGDTATVSVTVTCGDDSPVAVDDSATVAEDSGANTVDVLANDTDTDGGPIAVTSVTQPTNGTVVITNAGADLTYQPAADYCNAPPGTTLDTFTYTLAPGGDSATVTVTVTCGNDGPTLELDADDDKGTGGADFAVTFTEGEAAKLIEDSADATVADIDSATLASLTVTLTNLLDAGDETLSADVTGTSITASWTVNAVPDPDQGTLTLTGPDTVANFQTVLRTVRYANTDDQPDGTARIVQFVANDGTTSGNTATSTITVTPVDTDPTAVDDAATVSEDSGASAVDVLANDTDPDAGPISVTSVTQPTNGTVVITGGGTGVTYQPNANYCNSVAGPDDTFTYTLTPGGSTATVSVEVTCVDDNPVAVADAATVAEDSTNNAVDVLANDTDVDAGPKLVTAVNTAGTNGAVSITGGGTGVTYTPNANYCNNPPGTTLDTFGYTITGGSTATVTVTVTCVDDNPVAVADAATVVEDSTNNAVDVLANDTDVDGGPKLVTAVNTAGTNGSVSITGGGTGVTYTPNANYCNAPPGTTLDTFGYTVTGGSTATVTVTVTCVDDPPVAVNDAATVLEDSGTSAIDVLANDTDVDGGPKLVTAVDTTGTSGTVEITGGGTGVSYTPGLNYCNSSGSPTTFGYTITGGSTATVSVTVTCVNDPPTITTNPVTYATAGNTQLHVEGKVLAGVASIADAQGVDAKAVFGDVDGPVAPAIVDASGASTNGGSYDIDPNGSFTYVPPVGFTGTDSFTYQVTDTVSPVAGTVNVTVGTRVWYIHDVVDANNAAGGDGRSSNAFDTVAAFNAATTNDSDIIYVFAGNTATTPHVGSISLRNGQKLWGQGVDLDVPSFPDVVTATTLSRIRTTTASTNVVNVPASAGARTGVEIRGLDLEATGATSNAIDVTSSGAHAVGITIGANNIRGTTAEGIDLNSGSTGAFDVTLQTNTVTAAGNGIDARVSATGTTTITASSQTITSTGGNAFDARTLAGATALRVAFDSGNVAAAGNGIVIDGSAAGTTTITGFSNNTVSGTTVGTGISITTATFETTAGGAFEQVSGGTSVVGAPGVGSGVGGSGVVMSGVSGRLAYTDLDIFAEGGTGLQVNGTGAGTNNSGMRFTVGAGVGIIEATGGPAVSLNNLTADLQLATVKSTNTTSTGVSLTNVADGSSPGLDAVFSAGSGSSLTSAAGATGPVFNVSGGTGNVSYAGTITNNSTTARAVSLTTWGGDDGTDNITLSGAIDENGAGILVNGNTGSRPITFSGGMDIDTSTGEGFAATSNTNTGGLHITGTNDITSTSATALRVTSTTIGNSNLTFRNISSGNNTAAADPANGIVLDGTGTSGTLIVAGTGAADSGGTIQNATGDCIKLTNGSGPSLTRMRIQNCAGSGIDGTTITNFSLTNSVIDNVGTGLGVETSNVAFNDTAAGTERNLSGTVTITGNTLNNAFYHGVDIFNFNGTIDDLTISNNSFTSSSSTTNSKGSPIRLTAFGSASTVASVTRATINLNTITNFPSGAGISAQGGNANASGSAGTFGLAGNATNIIAITNNTITGSAAPNTTVSPAPLPGINQGVIASVNGKGQGNFNIASNTITHVNGNVISHSALGIANVTSTITSNIIDANHRADFGGPFGISVGVDQVTGIGNTATLETTISGNTVTDTDSSGIRATATQHVTGTGLRIKVLNNTIGAPVGTGAAGGIQVASALSSGAGTPQVCLRISGNTSDGEGGDDAGIALRRNSAGPNAIFGIHNLSAGDGACAGIGVPAGSPNVENFVNCLNPAGSGTLLISATTGFTSCSFP